MDDLDLPRPKGDVAAKLAAEDLAPFSRHELDERITLLKAEITRTENHRDKAAAHRNAADALFGNSKS